MIQVPNDVVITKYHSNGFLLLIAVMITASPPRAPRWQIQPTTGRIRLVEPADAGTRGYRGLTVP